MLSEGKSSSRTEVLLDLQTTACNSPSKKAEVPCNIPGSGAIRMGRWKLLHGHNGVWGPGSKGSADCVARQTQHNVPKSYPIPIPTNETNPWCPYGWTPPPRQSKDYELPIPAPESSSWPGPCADGQLPCKMPENAGYLTGHTLLFDVVDDMFEQKNVAAENPKVVAQLLARLLQYNMSHCSGQRCLPDNAGGPRGEPSQFNRSSEVGQLQEQSINKIWLPWRGNPEPAACDTNRSSAINPRTAVHSNMDSPVIHKQNTQIFLNGWCWDQAWSGGGVAPMSVQISVDDEVIVQRLLANISRAGLPSKTGAPNTEHGFTYTLRGPVVKSLLSDGLHQIGVNIFLGPSANSSVVPMRGSPKCLKNGAIIVCPAI